MKNIPAKLTTSELNHNNFCCLLQNKSEPINNNEDKNGESLSFININSIINGLNSHKSMEIKLQTINDHVNFEARFENRWQNENSYKLNLNYNENDIKHINQDTHHHNLKPLEENSHHKIFNKRKQLSFCHHRQINSINDIFSLLNIKSVFMVLSLLALSTLIVPNGTTPADMALNRVHQKVSNSTSFHSHTESAILNLTDKTKSHNSNQLVLSKISSQLSLVDDLLHEQTLEDAIKKLTQTWEQVHGSSTIKPNSKVDDLADKTVQFSDQMISSQVKLDTQQPLTKANANSDKILTNVHQRFRRRTIENDFTNHTNEDKSDNSRVYNYYTEIIGDKAPKLNNIHPDNSQAESIIKSLNEQSSLSGDNHSPKLSLNCTRCAGHDDARSMQIEAIKFNILNKLGMKHVPNISRNALPKIPPIRHFLERYPLMLGDDPRNFDSRGSGYSDEYFGPTSSDYDDGDDYYVNAERSIVFSQKPPTDRFIPDIRAEYFQFPANIINSHVQRAHLWLYVKQSANRELDNGGEIYIYQVVRPEFEGAPSLELARKKKISEKVLRKGDWIRIDIKKLVSKWFLKPEANLGISIHSNDSAGNILTILHHDDTGLDTALRPFIDVRVTTTQTERRRKRMAGLNCEDKSSEVRCCRYSLTVDFVKFGWDWIIAPKRYEANFCSGECPFVFMNHYPHTHIIQQTNVFRNSRGPCCSPRKMSPMSMLYMDDNGNIIYGLLPNMVVDRCGCS